ncbi:peroxisomal ATPase PEX1 isoform X2 [Halyomorpha halys]|uniref:peroxisomal ATPase PEX1 isoform X2 n=1 Tax=Halyomorpha halys TaxID=286706 RepID=UPI0006D4DF4B|nr:peroxisome biogenesis factor 1 isoform X2 [Halyomorpha halys]
MSSEIVFVRFINVPNCFIHLSKDNYDKLIGPSVRGLKLVTSDGRELYFSSYPVPYAGLTSECIGISNKYAKALQLKENEEIIVKPVYNIGSIQSVNVTPVSEDDFEILRSSSLEVEGSLLNQLRIIWPKQIFPVWVSRNVSVNLVVDSFSPSLNYGRLEEYTEVVVCDVVTKNDKEKIKPSTSIEHMTTSIKNLKEKLMESKTLKFRCVPLDKAPKQDNIFSTHPYVVFASEESIPEWALTTITSNRKTVWRLRKSDEDAMSCVVSLLIIELNECKKSSDHNFKHLYISNVLRNQLGLELGLKVSLDLVDYSEVAEITGILISPNFDMDKEKLITHVCETFTRAVNQHGDLLLNTKTSYPLKQGSIVVTLRPLHIEWTFVNAHKIKELTINLNEYNQRNDQIPKSSNLVYQHESGNSIVVFEELFEKGKLAIEISLALQEIKSYRFYDNIIYVGKAGSGKTSLVNYLLHKLNGPPFYIYTKTINCCLLKGKRVETLSKYLTDVLSSCAMHEPSVLFLDDLDILSVSLEDASEQAFHLIRITNKLVEMIQSYQAKHFFSVVGAVKSLDNINPKLFSKKGKSFFSTVVTVSDLSTDDGLELVKKLVFKITGSELSDDLFLRDIISQCEGYTPLDLKRLTEKAVFEAWQRKVQLGGKFVLRREDFDIAFKNSKPSSLQNINLRKGINKCWVNVGGLEEVKAKLMEVICWSTLYPEIMKQCPVKPQTGILLYGAPGTGKTLIASALAGESKMNFISIKGPELMSKYIGESEEGVRKLFEKAQAAKPCLLFFDEFDSLAPRRGQDQTGVTDRVVNQMLTALDGVDSLSGVWVIAATSRPDLIDPAILRPGRIGISVLCPLPDKDTRHAILKVLCKTVHLSCGVDLEEIASLTDGFTGADLRGLLTSAQIKTLDLLQDNDTFFSEENLSEKGVKQVELSKDCLMAALKELKPSLTPNEKIRYEDIYEKFAKRLPMDLSQQKVTHA